MKTVGTICIRLLVIAATGLVFVGPLFAVAPNGMQERDLAKIIDTQEYFDANQLLMFVTNNGAFAHDQTGMLGRANGLYYPRGSNKTVAYSAGLWVGAKVNGQTRVVISEYSGEYAPGVFGASPLDSRFHVYKINREDVPWSNPDYVNWPFADGAPTRKAADGSDSLDSYGNKIPLLIGDQTMWSVFNDGDPAYHTNDAGSTTPLGIEVQNTAFGFHRSDALGRVVFMNWKVKNTGSALLEDVYVSLWADPDIGIPIDDLAGCDSALDLGYCYNNGADDQYGGAVPPAVGVTLLQGPMVPGLPTDIGYAFGETHLGQTNLPMTAFVKYINGTDPKNATESYNYMQGFSATGGVVTDLGGNPTTLMMSGDPVVWRGWIDTNPDDCRQLISSGPFTLAVGDSQEVVVAVCVGQGTYQLSSITDLRSTVLVAKAAYQHRYDLPSEPSSPEMVIDIMPRVCPNVLTLYLDLPPMGPAKRSPLPPAVRDPNGYFTPVAVCGTPSLDVRDIDSLSLKLAGVRLSGFAYRDVTSPGVPDNTCDCLRGTPDGRVDLIAQVHNVRLYGALDNSPSGERVPVLCTGRLTDGRLLESSDCVSYRLQYLTDIVGTAESDGSDGVPDVKRTSAPDIATAGTRLDANYPNPFNAATTISYHLDHEGHVTLEVFNVLGQRTAVLVNDAQSAGQHDVTWTGKDEREEDVASGMYYYRLRTDDGVQSRKMILLK